MEKLKVFISSPYTKGDQGENVRIQMDMFKVLYEEGFMPFAPLLYHFQHEVHPMSYEEWMEIDFAWIESCDVVLRLPGESEGADREVFHAYKCELPVVNSLEGLKVVAETFGLFK
tara:strand:+ start:2257 stop:2601 length:345 start_codon:yes stop_codon:yes gene_type:complete